MGEVIVSQIQPAEVGAGGEEGGWKTPEEISLQIEALYIARVRQHRLSQFRSTVGYNRERSDLQLITSCHFLW